MPRQIHRDRPHLGAQCRTQAVPLRPVASEAMQQHQVERAVAPGLIGQAQAHRPSPIAETRDSTSCRCRIALSERSVRTSISCGPPSRAFSRLSPNSPGVAARRYSIPKVRATEEKSIWWGVPHSDSKCAGNWAIGKKEEIPPPALLRRTILIDNRWRLAVSRAPKSCNSARSPASNTVGRCEAAAIPRAVETTPSIPLAPRLAKTLSRLELEGAKASRSRTGMLFQTTRFASSGNLLASS